MAESASLPIETASMTAAKNPSPPALIEALNFLETAIGESHDMQTRIEARCGTVLRPEHDTPGDTVKEILAAAPPERSELTLHVEHLASTVRHLRRRQEDLLARLEI